MKSLLDFSSSKKINEFKVGNIIKVTDLMQKDYEYTITEPIGKNFHTEFNPYLTPPEMLKLGVFEGKYLNDCTNEFPLEWYQASLSKLSISPDAALNYFKIKSRQSLATWVQNGWITLDDPDIRGWFQWYCRYYLGRRNENIDNRQIKRWKAFNRHAGQIKANCLPKDLACRPKQRQALLQWAHNPFI